MAVALGACGARRTAPEPEPIYTTVPSLLAVPESGPVPSADSMFNGRDPFAPLSTLSPLALEAIEELAADIAVFCHGSPSERQRAADRALAVLDSRPQQPDNHIYEADAGIQRLLTGREHGWGDLRGCVDAGAPRTMSCAPQREPERSEIIAVAAVTTCSPGSTADVDEIRAWAEVTEMPIADAISNAFSLRTGSALSRPLAEPESAATCLPWILAARHDEPTVEPVALEAALARCAEVPALSASADYEAASLALFYGDREHALALFQRAAEADPGWAAPLREIGRYHLQDGNIEEARSYLTAATTTVDADAEAHTLLARIFAEHDQNYAAATALLRSAVAMDEENAGAWLALGRILEGYNHDLPGAAAAYADALEAEPHLSAAADALEALDARPSASLEALSGVWITADGWPDSGRIVAPGNGTLTFLGVQGADGGSAGFEVRNPSADGAMLNLSLISLDRTIATSRIVAIEFVSDSQIFVIVADGVETPVWVPYERLQGNGA